MARRKKQRSAPKKIRRNVKRSKRSIAAIKGWKTRKLNARLKFEGIDLEKSWEGKTRDGNPSGYTYERYRLDVLDSGTIRNIIAEVKRKHKGKRFFVGGQADFRDKDERLFTNNATLFTDKDSKAAQGIVDTLQRTIIGPSNPFQVGRSSKIDVEGTFVLVRFARENTTRKAKKKKKPIRRSKAQSKRSKVHKKRTKVRKLSRLGASRRR
jgi:hypothetical protein